ncbi:MAG: AzlC family ABC transporter permease, partial [Lachnospiraceae bacterium]|nr:AzlC family ABC transporter permease [Lachnospiraceae bacterium]
MRDGIPIAAGYFAVSLALGIAARNVGFSALQATAMSGLFHASAGEYVAITLAGAGAAYIEACMMELVANIRYLLLSFSLSQKLKTGTPLRHRLVLAYFLTDEIFGLSIRVPGFLNPFYSYGMITVASPAWILGSLFGVVLGNVLSARIVSALGISLFGMFLAIIIPPAKKDAVLLFFVTLAMLFSGLFSYLPLTSRIAPGLRTLLLT